MLMLTILKWFNLSLRGLMELGLVVALAQWGYLTGGQVWQKTVLSIAAPVVIFGFWGWFDFRYVVANPEPYRLVQELLLTFLAAYAWYSVGYRSLGWSLAMISMVHHALIYLLGERLIK